MTVLSVKYKISDKREKTRIFEDFLFVFIVKT